MSTTISAIYDESVSRWELDVERGHGIVVGSMPRYVDFAPEGMADGCVKDGYGNERTGVLTIPQSDEPCPRGYARPSASWVTILVNALSNLCIKDVPVEAADVVNRARAGAEILSKRGDTIEGLDPVEFLDGEIESFVLDVVPGAVPGTTVVTPTIEAVRALSRIQWCGTYARSPSETFDPSTYHGWPERKLPYYDDAYANYAVAAVTRTVAEVGVRRSLFRNAEAIRLNSGAYAVGSTLVYASMAKKPSIDLGRMTVLHASLANVISDAVESRLTTASLVLPVMNAVLTYDLSSKSATEEIVKLADRSKSQIWRMPRRERLAGAVELWRTNGLPGA